MSTRTRFRELAKRLQLSNPDEALDDLYKRYAERHRRYHTIHHIEHCLNVFDKYKAEIGWRGKNHGYTTSPSGPIFLYDEQEEQDIVEMALWIHDAVYQIGSRDNEIKSAELVFSFGLKNPSVAKKIHDLVLLTDHSKNHLNELHGNGPGQFIVDIDLSILGANWSDYENYTEAIRGEYSPNGWTHDYAIGRTQFLRRLQESRAVKPLFYWRPMVEAFADRAIANTKRELELLKCRLPVFEVCTVQQISNISIQSVHAIDEREAELLTSKTCIFNHTMNIGSPTVSVKKVESR